ncbi:MAG: hypothetical protein ACHQ50_04630 [Fimbriimonadales bacterium]
MTQTPYGAGPVSLASMKAREMRILMIGFFAATAITLAFARMGLMHVCSHVTRSVIVSGSHLKIPSAHHSLVIHRT